VLDLPPEELAALKADAARALEMAASHPWSKLLRDPEKAVSRDVWLVKTLANYARSHQRIAGSRSYLSPAPLKA
jgi:hypothetical protein